MGSRLVPVAVVGHRGSVRDLLRSKIGVMGKVSARSWGGALWLLVGDWVSGHRQVTVLFDVCGACVSVCVCVGGCPSVCSGV